MKHFFFCLLFILISYAGFTQNDFVGIAKYKITVEGSKNPLTDSMSVIFNKQRVKVILYLPDVKNRGHVSEKIFIDDFNSKKSITVNTENKTYKIDTLVAALKYDFANTLNIIVENNLLCFQYKADSDKFDKSVVKSVECLTSIDNRNPFIENYYFLGIQPIIIDNRIVTDFIITQADGKKQKTYIYDIKRLDSADSYFNLDGYKQEKLL